MSPALLLLGPLLGQAARARDVPHVCVAVWQGPTESCALDEVLEAKGAGRTETSARKQAAVRLRLVLASTIKATMIDAEGSVAAQEILALRSCLRLPEEELRLTCFPQPQLVQDGLCYADLPEDPCWEVGMHIVEGVGWQAQEQARIELCEQVQASNEQRSASRVESLRCNARCLASVRVRCP